MKAFVSDTHTIVWYLSRSKRLSAKVRTIFERANGGYSQIVIPSIVLVETILLVQRARLDQDVVTRLLALSEDPLDSIYIYPLHKGVIGALNQFGPAAIPELADRIIAATALYLNLPLLTVDEAIHASNLVRTIWQLQTEMFLFIFRRRKFVVAYSN